MRKTSFYRIFTIVFTFLFLSALGLSFAAYFTNNFHTGSHVLSVSLIALDFFNLAGFIANLVLCIQELQELKNLRSQNEYNFGKPCEYFNTAIIEREVEQLRRKPSYRSKPQSIMVFSGIDTNSANSTGRRDVVAHFNYLIMEYMEQIFVGKERKYSGKHLFGFGQGYFMVFSFNSSIQDLLTIMNDLTENIYRLADKNRIHLLVMPYFGVEILHSGEPVLEAVENASMARDVSQRNFEQITFYEDSFRKRATVQESDEIEAAIRNHEFLVYYQPKFDLHTNRFTSAEALIRWNSPKYGFLTPNQFMSSVQAAGLVHDLDSYVFEIVCEDLNDTIRRGRRILPVSMNFSLYEFYSPRFMETIMKTLDSHHVPANLVQIEILETTSQANPFLSVSIIRRLKEQGIKVLMDDFGIGYSNIGNLNRIPFDTIKIDKSYIDNITSDKKAREIVKLMVNLGKINGMEVIAEGVSTKAQVSILKEAGCDTIQGFYYSQALPKKEFDKFLQKNRFETKEEEA